jgi:aryl-alcohol dehydrogenase-like predicted oxidoreductase
MRKRTLGKTGLEVSELGLGTWGLSGDAYGPIAPAEQLGLIERARMLGITLFETADCYAAGKMEEQLGQQLAADNAAIIVTKWGTDRSGAVARKRFDGAYLREACERSLERLKRPKIHLGLLHNPSVNTLERREATETLQALKSEGKLLAWGVSAGDGASASAAIDAGAEVVSIGYNIFRRKPLESNLDRLKDAAGGVLAHSVLNYGQLCGLWSAYRQFRLPDHRAERWTTEELKQRVRHLDAVRPLIGGDIVSLRAAALRFVLNQSLVGCTIVGPKNGMQLDQLVREAGKAPPYVPEGKLAGLLHRMADLDVEA